MKKIHLRDEAAQVGNDRLTSVSLIRTVMSNSPNKSLSVEEIRKRVHILKQLDSISGSSVLLLEDDHHRCLADAMNSFPWSAATEALLNIIDDVLDAETVPAAKLVEKGGKN